MICNRQFAAASVLEKNGSFESQVVVAEQLSSKRCHGGRSCDKWIYSEVQCEYVENQYIIHIYILYNI